MPPRLRSRKDFDDLLERSKRSPVVLLKHSAACGLSTRGLREVEAVHAPGGTPCYVVVVQEARDVSDYVEEQTSVRHETPQVFVFAGGRVTYHRSHRRISRGELLDAIHESATEKT